MNQTKKLAVLGALTLAFAAPAFAQTAASDDTMAASGSMGKMSKSGGGTTLHKRDKAMHLHGASAAAAASAMGTNDKGAPH
jgi:hypothetical protein